MDRTGHGVMQERMRRACLVLCLVAFATSVHADEAAPKVTVTGYLEVFYSLNLRLPSNRITSLRGFDNRVAV